MRSRTLRTALVGVLVFIMTVDSATAFHLFGGFRGGSRGCWNCGPVVSHRWVEHSSCGSCGSCGSCDPCGSVVVDDGCSSCGEVIHQAAPGSIYAPQPTHQPSTVNRMDDTTAPPQLHDDTVISPSVRDTQPAPDVQPPTPRPAQPAAQPPVQPVMPTPTDDPVPVARPAERSSLDDLFGPTTPTTPTPSTPTTPAPTTPAPTTPAPTTPAPTTPAPTTPTTPDDLFGPTTPTTPATEPATTPATTPGGGLDDLFGPAGGGATPPAAGAADTPAATDTSPSSGLDDLFGPAGGGAATPAGGSTEPAATAPADNAIDDLFAPVGGGTTPATTPADDDLFKSGAILREDGGLASDQNRVWVDNTGGYQTRARLVTFLDGHVRLLKDNGRTTTVPLYRLSQNDLEFVNRQASAQRATRFNETVQNEIAVPLAAN